MLKALIDRITIGSLLDYQVCLLGLQVLFFIALGLGGRAEDWLLTKFCKHLAVGKSQKITPLKKAGSLSIQSYGPLDYPSRIRLTD